MPETSAPVLATAEDNDRRRTSSHGSQGRELGPNATFSNFHSGTALALESLPANFSHWLQYFVCEFTPSTFPTVHIRHECDILRIAATEGSQALLHALCAISTIHQILVLGNAAPDQSIKGCTDLNGVGRTFLNHKQRAVVLLRKDLSIPGAFQISSSVATVALLLMIESLSGDTTTAGTHKFGLLELVKRYCASNFPLQLMVSDVSMADIKSATSTLARPSIRLSDKRLSDFEKLKYLPFDPYRLDLAALGSGFVTKKMGFKLGSDLVLLLCAMRNLINDVERIVDTKPVVADVNGTHFLALEHQLLSSPSATSPDRLVNTRLAELCRIGAILYCNLCLWTWPRNATLINNLLFHLRAAISSWISIPDALEQHQVLLWLYFMGDFACPNAEERQWYFEGMGSLLAPLKILREDDFRSVLADFFYVDRLMGHHLEDCYAKISYRNPRERSLLP